MRTTLDLYPEVLSAARAKAQAEHISLGAAVSQLALAGLCLERERQVTLSAFPVLHGVPGHIVTDELVAVHCDDDSSVDARF